jgi:hypothetical protein
MASKTSKTSKKSMKISQYSDKYQVSIEKYLKYANTEESFAVLFVKKYLNSSLNHWIDIVESDYYNSFYSYDLSDLEFRYVICDLYNRKIKPKYPPKDDFIVNGNFDQERYYLVVRSITWETAHRDIDEQINKKNDGKRYKITGIRYRVHNALKKIESLFEDNNIPSHIKSLKEVLSPNDPLWEKVIKYYDPKFEQEYSYKITKIIRLKH